MNAEQHETDDFRRGYAAGYAARVREELSDYLTMIKSGRAVYDRVIRDIVELPSAAERKAAREATLREAHAAELHAGSLAYGCPVCEEAGAVVRTLRQCPRCGAGPYATEEWLQGHMNEECPERDAASDRHHNGDYGVPLTDCTGITATMIDLSGRRGASCPINGLGDPWAGAIYPTGPAGSLRTVADFRCTTHGMRGCPTCGGGA